MSHFLESAYLEDIFCLLVEICVLSEIHTSKIRLKPVNENLRPNVYARMFWKPVYKISHPKLHKQLKKVSHRTSLGLPSSVANLSLPSKCNASREL